MGRKLPQNSTTHPVTIKSALRKGQLQNCRSSQPGTSGVLGHAFGLCNTTATFQQTMNKTFADKINFYILVYLDDIFVYTRSVKEHRAHLRRALERLRAGNLYGQLHKCELQKSRIVDLRFDMSVDGIHASLDKVKSVWIGLSQNNA